MKYRMFPNIKNYHFRKKKRSQEFFELNGFEMSLLNSWQDSGWFPIDQVDLIVTGLSDVEAKLEGSYQKLLTQFLEVEKKLAFSFKMRVGQEADSDAIYFVLSYPQKFNLRDKKNSTELPLLTWEDFWTYSKFETCKLT